MHENFRHRFNLYFWQDSNTKGLKKLRKRVYLLGSCARELRAPDRRSISPWLSGSCERGEADSLMLPGKPGAAIAARCFLILYIYAEAHFGPADWTRPAIRGRKKANVN